MNNDLEQRIRTLEAWKAEKERQQLTYPLDGESLRVLNRYFLTVDSRLDYTNAQGIVFPHIILKQNDVKYLLWVELDPVAFVVDTASDLIRTFGGVWNENNIVYFRTTNDLPSPLTEDPTVDYYVRNLSGNTFNVATRTGDFTFTATLSGGATSGTLTSNWASATGSYEIDFSNGDTRVGTFTNGNTSVTWTTGLSGAATEDITVYKIQDITDSGTGTHYIFFLT